MVDELHILHLLNIKGILGLAPRIIYVIWQPPPIGWIKVNTDGSAMGSPGAAGSGGIFKNASAFPRGSFAFSMGSTFAYMAELIAAIFAIEVAWERGWHHLWLECDSTFVAQLFHNKSSKVPWQIKQR